MAYEKSVYREVGISARTVARAGKRPPEYKPTNITAKEVIRFGHYWMIQESRDVRGQIKRGVERCRSCRKPRFIAEGIKCSGKKR